MKGREGKRDAYKESSKLNNHEISMVFCIGTMDCTHITSVVCIDCVLEFPCFLTLFQMVEVQVEEISPPEFIIFAASHFQPR